MIPQTANEIAIDDEFKRLRDVIAKLKSERDAAIAAAVQAEREACAKVAESARMIHGMQGGEIAYSRETARDIAAAIRARGNGSR